MTEELKLSVDTGDLIALVQARYGVTLTTINTGDGDVHFSVGGLPLNIARIHGALKRAHKAQR